MFDVSLINRIHSILLVEEFECTIVIDISVLMLLVHAIQVPDEEEQVGLLGEFEVVIKERTVEELIPLNRINELLHVV